jgi:hypothetical protein
LPPATRSRPVEIDVAGGQQVGVRLVEIVADHGDDPDGSEVLAASAM